MKKFIFINTEGLITSVINPGIAGMYVHDGQYGIHVAKEVDASLDDNVLLKSYWDFTDNSIKALPIKPTYYHDWDKEAKAWVILLEKVILLKQSLANKINLRRTELSVTPITYNSNSFDADATAQANIKGKLQEIFAREAVGTPLVNGEMFWKDADNVVYSWSTQDAYKAWLQGLVIAISSRNTALYAAAWAKKAELEALTEINDIINYDVSAGWTI